MTDQNQKPKNERPTRSSLFKRWLSSGSLSLDCLRELKIEECRTELDEESLVLLSKAANKVEDDAFRALLDDDRQWLSWTRKKKRESLICLGFGPDLQDERRRKAIAVGLSCQKGRQPAQAALWNLFYTRSQTAASCPWEGLVPRDQDKLGRVLLEAGISQKKPLPPEHQKQVRVWLEQVPSDSEPLRLLAGLEKVLTADSAHAENKSTLPAHGSSEDTPKPNSPASSIAESKLDAAKGRPIALAGASSPPATSGGRTASPPDTGSADHSAEVSATQVMLDGFLQKPLQKLAERLTKEKVEAEAAVRDANERAEAAATASKRLESDLRASEIRADNLERELLSSQERAQAGALAREQLERDVDSIRRTLEAAEEEAASATAALTKVKSEAEQAEARVKQRLANKERSVLAQRLNVLRRSLEAMAEQTRAAVEALPEDASTEARVLKGASKNLAAAVAAAISDLAGAAERANQEAAREAESPS